MESKTCEDAVKAIEMTTKDLTHYINSVDKAGFWEGLRMVEFERIDFNFERNSTVGKILKNNISCYRWTIHERKDQWGELHCYFKKLP